MERNEVLKRMVEICKDVFNKENLVITETTSAVDIEEWDSLTHLNLISDLEDEYDINFTLDEITKSRNIGELLSALIKHIDGKK